RLFSLRSLVEFGKSFFKLILIGGACALVIIPQMDFMPRMVGQSTTSMIGDLWDAVLLIVIVVLALMTVIAGIDFLYQRYEHDKKLRMTKQQVKDEYKQTEGDPQIKARLRQIRTQRARARMMQNVPESDVVVTNPTHYAVALKYDQGEMAAPKVTAKGQDLVALKIREIAEENEVPIVENPPLARALHAGVELEEEVPPEHYQAVAEIIGYVMRLKSGVRETYTASES
ncbi:MAG: flagellar type III secretion system protein FlhB, partial [Pseudomonadota bacterium]